MDLREAVALLAPAVPSGAASWVDFGAGRGVFTRALAAIIGAGGHVLAIDRDDDALRALANQPPLPGAAQITTLAADFTTLDAVPPLGDTPLDGALFANALHFIADPEPILARAQQIIEPHGRVVVIEYEGRPANPWVPYPVSVAKLRRIGGQAGYTNVDVVGQRASAYGGVIYCATLYGARSASGHPG